MKNTIRFITDHDMSDNDLKTLFDVITEHVDVEAISHIDDAGISESNLTLMHQGDYFICEMSTNDDITNIDGGVMAILLAKNFKFDFDLDISA